MSKKQVKIFLKFLAWFTFIIYLLLLVNIVLLKEGSAISMAISRGEEIPLSRRLSAINFVPLKTIIPYLKGEPSFHIAFENIIGNIVAFSPLGFLLPILFKRCERIKNTFWISLGVSLLIEVLQLILNLGSCDIDDLILNVSGSLLGFRVYVLFRNFYRRKVDGVYSSKIRS